MAQDETKIGPLVMGIDPGGSGGIAVLDLGGIVWDLHRMPPTPRLIMQAIAAWRSQARPTRAMIEFVHSSPQMGVKSAFTFGMNKGILLASLEGSNVPYIEVLPKTWQKAMGVAPRGEKSATEHKNVTKALAQGLFPRETVTHATADALLIAEYYRRLLLLKG